MRRHLGRSFTLVRIAWAALVASLVVALAVVHDAPVDGIATQFGLVLIGGWLLTFLLAILQRIVPFLASMHAAQAKTRGSGLPPTPSALTAERPLAIHFACHLAALALLAIARRRRQRRSRSGPRPRSAPPARWPSARSSRSRCGGCGRPTTPAAPGAMPAA